MSLYETLGVRKDATPEQIKRAYRKRAKETHPDKPGGDKEAFQKLASAYALLSDDGRRAEYDQTGDADPDRVNKLAVIAGMLFSVIDQCESVDHEHLVDYIRVNISQGMNRGEELIGELRVKISKRERAKKRITKISGNNMLAEMIQGNIDLLNRQIDSTELQIAEGREMLKLLEDYGYLCEMVMPTMQIDVRYISFTQGTSNGLR